MLPRCLVALVLAASACGPPPPVGPPKNCVNVGEGVRELRLIAQGSHAAARTDLKADFGAATLAGESFAMVGARPRPVRVDRALTAEEREGLSAQLGRICAVVEPAQPIEDGTGHTYFEVTSDQGTVVLQREAGKAPIEAGRRVARLPEPLFDDLLVAFPVDGSGEPILPEPEAPPPEPSPSVAPSEVAPTPSAPVAPKTGVLPCRRGTEDGFAMALVLDRSGSMTGERMEAARTAAVALIAALGPTDRFQLIAFDSQPTQVHPLIAVGDRRDAEGAVRQVRPGGGTEGLPALQLAYEALREAGERHRHVLFVTDGMMPPRGMSDMAADFADCGISLSTVGLGDGIDRKLLEDLAKAGGGRFRPVLDLATLSTTFVDDLAAARTP